MGCLQTVPAIEDEEMEKYLNLVKDKFDPYTITKMHKMFYREAPNGLMNCVKFQRYLEKLSLDNVIGDTTKVDIDAQSKRLFRGYDLNRDGEITFHEYLLYQEAILFRSPRLVSVIFSILDRDQDGSITKEDFICMTQGSDEPEIDDLYNLIAVEAEGVWQFLIGGATDAETVSLDTFSRAVEECPEMLLKLTELV